MKDLNAGYKKENISDAIAEEFTIEPTAYEQISLPNLMHVLNVANGVFLKSQAEANKRAIQIIEQEFSRGLDLRPNEHTKEMIEHEIDMRVNTVKSRIEKGESVKPNKSSEVSLKP